MLHLIVVIVTILLLSGFFSGTEAALVSLTEAETEAMRERNLVGSMALATAHKYLNRSVITIVICNNIVNIVGSIMVGQIVIELYNDAVLAIITTALTFGIIVFSEVIPKSVGIHYAATIARYSSPVIVALTTVFLPLIAGLEWVTKLFTKGERKVGTEEQIRSLVTIGRRRGHIESDEGRLIHRAFILNDKTAHDIMTPLKDIVGLQEEMSIQEAWEKVENDWHSRYPVFGPSINDVLGTVLRQDILEKLEQGKKEEHIDTILREPLIVLEDMQSDALLALFRDRNMHLAVVQDNEGHTVGIVTLEDVLEELVGEIEDEKDVED